MPKQTIAELALELIAAERAVTIDQVVTAALERTLTRAKDPSRRSTPPWTTSRHCNASLMAVGRACWCSSMAWS